MKSISTVILLLVFAVSASAQTFTLSELIKLNEKQSDDFDTYVIQKGYTYYKTDNFEDIRESTVYVLFINDVYVSLISKAIFKKSKKEMLTFKSNDEKTYLKVKSELKLLGFEFVKKENNENGAMIFDYVKGDVELTLISIFKDGKTSYEISVTRVSN